MSIEEVRDYALSMDDQVTERLFADKWLSWRICGKWFLLIGLVLFDMGIFAMTLIDQAKILTLIYIIGSHAVVAVLGMIRAVGNKKDNNPGWKIDLAQGIGAIIQITICIVFIRSDLIPVYSYCVYAVYSAVLMIIRAFKKNAIVYVQ
jgi:uncharacterized membrane protein HdeD (DUF308 family)